MSDLIMRVTGLRKSYTLGKARQEVLRGVDLSVQRGEFLAIMGASGSGKSTLLHIMGLLDKADTGSVEFEGEDMLQAGARRQDKIRNKDMGFVFQFYHLLPELTVRENVLLPAMVGQSWLGWLKNGKNARQRADELIEEVGLTPQAAQRPTTLSGGERQRAALARALMVGPKLLLADEPTGNLDSAAGKVILELLWRLNRAGQTIVMVTHDSAVAAGVNRTLVLRDGLMK